MDINQAIQQIPQDKALFSQYVEKFQSVNLNLEKYQIAYVLFIGSYYHDRAQGSQWMDWIQRLSGKVRDYPPFWNIFNSMMIQSHYYAPRIKGEQVELQKEKNKLDAKWKPLNPFMLPYKDSAVMFLVGMRITNFDKVGTNYFSAHGGKIKNYYEAQLASFANLKQNKKVVFDFLDKTDYKKFSYDWSIVEGFEDYRAVAVWDEHKNDFDYYACVVSVDTHHEGCPRQSLVKMEFHEKNKLLTISNLKPLRAANSHTIVNNKECQKNWLPFVPGKNSVYKGKMLAIYSTDPLQIIEIHPKTGMCTDIYNAENKKDSPYWNETFSFRGGSPPIEWKTDLYLYSVHIVGFLPEQKGRVYYHRLVEMYHKDKEFTIKRMSKLFYLNQSHTVEYISGSFHNITTQQIIFSYGLDDKHAMLCAVHYDEIEALFS